MNWSQDIGFLVHSQEMFSISKTSHLSHGDICKHSHLCILLAFCQLLFINKNLLVLDYFVEMISTLRLYNCLHKPSIWEIIQIFIAWVATSSPKQMLDFTGKTIYLLPGVCPL